MAKLDKDQLAKLSKEQKLDLIDALREKKKRQLRNKPKFKPNEGQLPVLISEKKEIWCTSANGMGKTTCAIHWAVWKASGYNPLTEKYNRVPNRVVVLLDNPEKVQDVWLSEMGKWFDMEKWDFQKRGKPYVKAITFPNGSEIIFMFHLQEPMAFESIEFAYLVADEPMPRYIFLALRRGMRAKGHKSQLLVIGTPISQAWIRTEIIEPWSRGERLFADCFTASTYVNRGNLEEGYIEGMEAVLSEKEKRIRLHGEFYDLSGLALAHLFRRDAHIIAPFRWPQSWPCIVAIDPAMNKSHVAALVGVDHNDNLYYIKELVSSPKQPPRAFARDLRNWYRDFPIQDIICDSLGSSALSGGEGVQSFIDVLNDEGVRARATRYHEKDDERWIELIQNVLYIPRDDTGKVTGHPRLRIFEGNRGVVTDIENVSWVKFKNEDIFKPKLDISKKDFLACLKYALAASPTHAKNKAPIYRAERVSFRDREIY